MKIDTLGMAVSISGISFSIILISSEAILGGIFLWLISFSGLLLSTNKEAQKVANVSGGKNE